MAQEKWLVDEPKVIDTGIVRTLRVGLVGGQVDVVAHDEPTARVEVHSVSGKQLKIEVDGDTLTVDHPQIRWDDPIGFLKSFRGKALADVSILVPATPRSPWASSRRAPCCPARTAARCSTRCPATSSSTVSPAT